MFFYDLLGAQQVSICESADYRFEREFLPRDSKLKLCIITCSFQIRKKSLNNLSSKSVKISFTPFGKNAFYKKLLLFPKSTVKICTSIKAF